MLKRLGVRKTAFVFGAILVVYFSLNLVVQRLYADDSGTWRGILYKNTEFKGESRILHSQELDYPRAPFKPGLPRYKYSIDWRSCFELTQEEAVTFQLASDDGSRLYLDDQLIIDNWGDHAVELKESTIRLSKGRHHLQVKYYQNEGGAALSLRARIGNVDFENLRPCAIPD